MATDDTCCTIVPYFKVSAENLSAFKALCERFVAQTNQETGCLYYGFSFGGGGRRAPAPLGSSRAATG